MLAGTAPVRPLLNAFMAQKGSAVQFAVQSHVHVPLGDGIEIEFTSPAHAMACSSSACLCARARMRTDTRSGRSAPAYVGEALNGAAVGVSTVGALVSPSRVGEAVLTLRHTAAESCWAAPAGCGLK